jgi:2-methylcitrate dehydratase PrpD
MNERIIPAGANYISTALSNPLPEPVREKTRFHVLDTVAAMITGARLKPGEAAINFVRSQGGTPESTVVGSDILTTATNAAMANAMLAHSDETDDSHAPSLTHPGCAIVPAALAVAEREKSDADTFLKAVALGYDISSRIGRAMGGIGSRDRHGHATHAIGPMFGAAAAASALAGLDERGARHALAYTVQQASGIVTWERDPEHVEKSFVFGGVGARNGVTSAMFVQSGMTGEENAFTGDFNFLEMFCPEAHLLGDLVDTLGSHYEISITNIKRFSVGSPIQAAADAMVQLVEEHKLKAEDIEHIAVSLPPMGAKIVNGRTMPDVNLQYALAAILLDGGKLTFAATHDYERLSSPDIMALMARTSLHGDPDLQHLEAKRPARLNVTLKNGRDLEKYVPAVRGTADNPMTKQEVEAKCLDLLSGVIGETKARQLIKLIWDMDTATPILSLRPLLVI